MRRTPRDCHPEPFGKLTCACGTGAGRINSEKGLSERFFAALRMTRPRGSLYFLNASAFIGVGGRRPERKVAMFSAASVAIRVRVAILALPTCGTMRQ